MIPFTVFVDDVHGRAVGQGVEAPRTLLVLELVGQPHPKSPQRFFYHCPRINACSLLLSMPRGVCHALGTLSARDSPAHADDGGGMLSTIAVCGVGVILQRSRKGQNGVKPCSDWRPITCTAANGTLQPAALLPALVSGRGGGVPHRDIPVLQRRDGERGDPPHRLPYRDGVR